MEKEILLTQKYIMEVVSYTDGTKTMNRTNEGFSLIEMLGMVELVRSDIVEHFKYPTKGVDEINRKSKGVPFIYTPPVPNIEQKDKPSVATDDANPTEP